MLILKSASPRRREFLESLGFEFQILVADVDETTKVGERPLEYLKRVTLAKLERHSCEDKHLYIAADTIVVHQGDILMKPQDWQDAQRMLQRLSGTQHSVYSGLALFGNRNLHYTYDQTQVLSKTWTQQDIEAYLQEYKPFDKAGSYGVQDKGGPVQELQGSYSNVVGFPLRKFYLFSGLWKQYLGDNV
ncbi:MAG: Maf family protein [Spirochaetota bacterium]